MGPPGWGTCEDFESNGLEISSMRRVLRSLKFYAVLLEMQAIGKTSAFILHHGRCALEKR